MAVSKAEKVMENFPEFRFSLEMLCIISSNNGKMAQLWKGKEKQI